MAPSANDPTPSLPRRIGVRLGMATVVAGALTAGWLRFHQRHLTDTHHPERTARELVRTSDQLWDQEAGRPFTGWLVERYPDSILKSRSWLSNGILHGISEGWYTNGTLQIREHFEAGLSEGPVSRWREDGTRLSEGTSHAGKLDGRFQRWHPNGQLAEEVSFRAGVPDGISRAWHPDGSVKAEVRHEKGAIVDRHFWKPGEKPDRPLSNQVPPSS